MKIDRFKRCTRCASIMATLIASTASLAHAEQSAQEPWSRPTLSFMGVPGLIDMPSGNAMSDADLAFTVGSFDGTVRNTAYFQITPRISGVFRYSYIKDFSVTQPKYYDRSFDLRYLLTPETSSIPAVTIGLQDFGGTGIYAGEYIVATKTFGRLRATGGIGWGRFGSYNGFDNPLGALSDKLKTRPTKTGDTGQLETGQWFRGDAALFGGLQYQLGDQIVLTAEYSSDAYDAETARGLIDQKSPLNFGASYRFRNGLDVSAAYLYGSEAAVRVTYTFNPKNPTNRPGGVDPAPPLVAMRAPGAAADLGWTQRANSAEILRGNVAEAFSKNGLRLDAMAVDGRSVQVRFRNTQYTNSAQAIGRATRILTNVMPASVETFVLTPVTANGLSASRITLARSDVEELVHAPDGAWQSLARADVSDAYPPDGIAPSQRAFPDFNWGIGPYLSATYFDPSQPVRLDLGVEVTASYEPQPGLLFEGSLRRRVLGNRGELRSYSSKLQRVRTDSNLYARDGETALTTLFAAKYFRPGEDLYGRLTVGYLESMYGGVSGELLWKPVASRLALGVEANYARQRDFDQDFGFQDYDVVMGHVSTYYDAGNGFNYQLDVGRYLAGDWGATVSIDREFDNGIRIGAFATLTEVPFDDFGEGSFDKGITFSVPLSALTGTLTQFGIGRTVRPVLRDGGAGLSVPGRLYEGVRAYHQPALQSKWGRVWR